jgi:hypothetical protein
MNKKAYIVSSSTGDMRKIPIACFLNYDKAVEFLNKRRESTVFMDFCIYIVDLYDNVD